MCNCWCRRLYTVSQVNARWKEEDLILLEETCFINCSTCGSVGCKQRLPQLYGWPPKIRFSIQHSRIEPKVQALTAIRVQVERGKVESCNLEALLPNISSSTCLVRVATFTASEVQSPSSPSVTMWFESSDLMYCGVEAA